jgi:chemotaxis methyl-accepting protein methylase
MKLFKMSDDRKLSIKELDVGDFEGDTWAQEEVWIRVGKQYLHGWASLPYKNADSSGQLMESVTAIRVAFEDLNSKTTASKKYFQISVGANDTPEEIKGLMPKLFNQIEKRVGICYNENHSSLLYLALKNYSFNTGIEILELTQLLCNADKNHSHDEFFSGISMTDTRFFRDQPFYSHMREVVLPDLYKKNINKKEIAIWVAACSTGEEVYSVAIEALNFFPSSEKWTIKIFASDLSNDAIQISEKGIYPKSNVISQIDDETISKFFIINQENALIKPEVSELCSFASLNLNNEWPEIGPFDLILIRNVLYYFRESSQREIMLKIKSILNPNTAYVCLGLGEKMIDSDFVNIKPDSCIFRLN